MYPNHWELRPVESGLPDPFTVSCFHFDKEICKQLQLQKQLYAAII